MDSYKAMMFTPLQIIGAGVGIVLIVMIVMVFYAGYPEAECKHCGSKNVDYYDNRCKVLWCDDCNKPQ